MSSRKTTIIGAGVVIIVLAVILITGRKSINVVNGVNGYSDENSIYNQANLILGEEQVYGVAGKIITEVANDGQIYNVAFNVSTQKFDMACSKPGCVHNKSDCISRIDMICAQNIGEDIYYIPSDNKTNIWKSVNGETDLIYKNNEEISTFRMTNEYIFIETDTGIYRISNDKTKEQISDKHSQYGDIYIVDDNIYLVLEDSMLYRMKTDGSGFKKILNEKVAFAQVYNNRIYVRSMEYDPEGRWELNNELFSVDLNGEDRKTTGIKCMQYVISKGDIYYTELPDDNYTCSIRRMDIDTGENTEIAKNVDAGCLQVIDESPYIIFYRVKYVKEDQIYSWYCVSKNGGEEKALEYPELIK